MADTVAVKFIHPPNWDVTEQQIEGYRRVIVQLSGISDGSGESAVKKIDISTLLTSNNKEVTRIVVENIKYDNYGFTNIKLEWDRNPKEVIAILPGNNSGEIHGPLVDKDDGESNGVGNTGDILLTSSGPTDGDSYNITLTLKLKDSAPSPIGAG